MAERCTRKHRGHWALPTSQTQHSQQHPLHLARLSFTQLIDRLHKEIKMSASSSLYKLLYTIEFHKPQRDPLVLGTQCAIPPGHLEALLKQQFQDPRGFRASKDFPEHCTNSSDATHTGGYKLAPVVVKILFWSSGKQIHPLKCLQDAEIKSSNE